MIALHFLLIAALSLVMGKAAKYIAGSIRAIALTLGFSEFLVAFVFLGFATSTPEISVALFSAIEGTPGLSLGNLLGANIVVLSLLCGLAAILAGRLSPGEFYKNHTLQLFLADILMPVYAIADGRLTRIDGVFLMAAHLAFIGHVYKSHSGSLKRRKTTIAIGRSFKKQVLVALTAVAVLLVASYFLVNSALAIAAALGIAPLIVGLLMFSIGTNLPELAFVITESRKDKEVVLGDLFGNVLVNTPTLGLLALISPFTITQKSAALTSGGFLVALVVIFGIFMWTKKSLNRREGYMLLACYAAYLAYYIRFL